MTLLYVTANYGVGGPGLIAYQAVEAMSDWLESKRAAVLAPPPDVDLPLRDAFVDRLSFLWMRDHGKDLTVLHAFNNVAYVAMTRATQLDRMRPRMNVERASTHPDHQRRILAPEREKYGQPPSLYDDACHLQMCWEINHADHVLTPSEQAGETIRDAIQLEHGMRDFVDVRVIPFGSDPERFTPAPADERKDGFRVLYLGMSWIRKGYVYLLKAFLEAAQPGWRLMANLPHDLFQRPKVPEGARLVHAGPVKEEEKPNLFRSYHVFALPSFEEGQAIAVWEALASGLPVVCSRECGHPMIEEAKAGLFVKPGDEKGIAEALRWYADNPSEVKAQGKNARALALTRTWADYRRDVRKLWEECGA